ncbi:hypothetical protein FLA_5265 [Filimonas lacunae]|nr:hypothetical protein FLA_5265 [Filimonas lacunae]
MFILAICAIAIGGSYHYSKELHKKYLTTGASAQNNTTKSAAEEQSEKVGHIFWESVTRLIVSAKN